MGTLKLTLTENPDENPVQLTLEAWDPRRRRCVIMGVFGKSCPPSRCPCEHVTR